MGSYYTIIITCGTDLGTLEIVLGGGGGYIHIFFVKNGFFFFFNFFKQIVCMEAEKLLLQLSEWLIMDRSLFNDLVVL